MRFVLEDIITARKRTYGKVMFSQAGIQEEGGTYPQGGYVQVGGVGWGRYSSSWDGYVQGVGTHPLLWVCPWNVGTQSPRYMGLGILLDTVGKRAMCILLECEYFPHTFKSRNHQ